MLRRFPFPFRLLCALLLLGACGAAPAREGQAAERCLVERVIDGDTLVCEGGTRVRLLLIDTPEMDQGEHGGRAREALVALLPPGESARMEYDVERLDRYGRTLAYLYLADGRMANLEMARSGFAVVLSYPPNVKYIDAMRVAVAEAREARRGLWATSAFSCEPREHRRGDCE
jgi:micrococcal nuclease